MNYTSQSQAISDQQQQARVAQAAIKKALAVMSEAGSTAGHAQRAALAVAVLGNPAHYGEVMLRSVVTFSAAGANDGTDPLKDDNALGDTISAVWNAYAAYSPAA